MKGNGHTDFLKACLISSNKQEIDMFQKYYKKPLRIISHIDGSDALVLDNLKDTFKNIDCCIIGETPYYCDRYIESVKNVAKNTNTKVVDYHSNVGPQGGSLQEIMIPVILVSSLLPDMRKANVAYEIASKLEAKGLRPLLIEANPIWDNFGQLTFPFWILRSNNPIPELNMYLVNKIKETNKDIVVLSVPGGIISSAKYNRFCDFGLLNFIIDKALAPDFIINCIYEDTQHVDFIPEPFASHKIDVHVKTGFILDRNDYDFTIKNRNVDLLTRSPELWNHTRLALEQIADRIFSNVCVKNEEE